MTTKEEVQKIIWAINQYVEILKSSGLPLENKIKLADEFIEKIKVKNLDRLRNDNKLIDEKYINEFWNKIRIAIKTKIN